MSIFLAIILALFLAGIFVTYFLAVRDEKYATIGAIIVVSVSLFIWIVARRILPLTSTILARPPAEMMVQWTLLVDELNWQMSFHLLLLVETMLITHSSFNHSQSTSSRAAINRWALPSILAMAVAGLLSIWSSSLIGLIYSWTLLAVVWLLISWLNKGSGTTPRNMLARFGFLFLSSVFLLLAVAASGFSPELPLIIEELPLGSFVWAILAALTQLGAIPFHWWRPLKWPLSPAQAALIHLLPVVAGTALLARLAPLADLATTIATLLTGFGWLGMVVGALIAWKHFRRPLRAITGLALAQAGLMVLIATWADSESVVSACRVLILAVGSLYLMNHLSKERFPWYVIIPLASLAGLPLTAGFLGLAPVYIDWLATGRVGLLLMTGVLIVPIIAASILISRQIWVEDQEMELVARDRIQLNVGLLLPTLGLFVLPSPDIFDIPFVIWLILILTVLAGIMLSRFQQQINEKLGDASRGIKTTRIVSRYRTIIIHLSQALIGVIREMAGILEGESGMLWLLILAVVIWFSLNG